MAIRSGIEPNDFLFTFFAVSTQRRFSQLTRSWEKVKEIEIYKLQLYSRRARVNGCFVPNYLAPILDQLKIRHVPCGNRRIIAVGCVTRRVESIGIENFSSDKIFIETEHPVVEHWLNKIGNDPKLGLLAPPLGFPQSTIKLPTVHHRSIESWIENDGTVDYVEESMG